MEEFRPLRILVVDDDEDILDLLKYNLEKEGFKVRAVRQSSRALRVALEFFPDLIILDMMMPHPNGIELCREFRNNKLFRQTYIFFLTAKSEGYYQQAALQTGGDDYVEKITGLRMLTNKISFVLKKRFVIRKRVNEITSAGWKLNRSAGTVTDSFGHEFFLNKQEFELLFFFAQNPGRLVSADHLVHILWGSDVYQAGKSIEQMMQNLQRKTGFELIQKTHDNRYRLKPND